MPKVSRLEVIETGARRQWSPDEKQRIVAESLSAPRNVSATARRHGLSSGQLFTWCRLARQGKLVLDGDAGGVFLHLSHLRINLLTIGGAPNRPVAQSHGGAVGWRLFCRTGAGLSSAGMWMPLRWPALLGYLSGNDCSSFRRACVDIGRTNRHAQRL
jgi:transposase-like protein